MKLTEFAQLAQDIELPKNRISDNVIEALNNNNLTIDCHCHIFDTTCVPLPYISERYKPKGFVAKLMKSIKDITCTDIDDFIKIISYSSMKQIVEHYYKYKETSTTIIAPLIVDMQFGWDNYFPKKIRAQVDEIKILMDEYPITPFFPLDPRQIDTPPEGQPNLYENFIHAFSGEKCFTGVKIYPSMGFLPSDPKLLPFFEICEKKQIPVTTHCGEDVINQILKEDTIIEGTRLINGERTIYQKTLKKHQYFKNGEDLSNPIHWREVLEMFPNLKLNLAHFGGFTQWKKYSYNKYPPKISAILELINEYDHVYTDFAYTLSSTKSNKNLRKELKRNPELANKLLYGTDYHLVLINGRLIKSIDRFKKSVYPYWEQISKVNPTTFLGLN